MNLIFYIATASLLAIGGYLDIRSSQWFGKYDFDDGRGNHQRNFEASKLFANADGRLNNQKAAIVLIVVLGLQFLAFALLPPDYALIVNGFCVLWAFTRFLSATRNRRREKVAKENYERFLVENPHIEI